MEEIPHTFNCSKCNKELSSKRRLVNHETKCNGLDKLQCELCHKKLNSAQSKYLHKKKQVCERNGTMIKQSFNHDFQHSFNTYNNCKIVNFDEEIFRASWETLHDCIEKGFAGIIEMIKLIHFNKEFPENRNIKKQNKRDSFVSVFKDNEWKSVLAEQVINDLIEHATEPLNEYIFEKLHNNTPTDIKYRFIRDIIQDYLQIRQVLQEDLGNDLDIYLKNPVNDKTKEKLKKQCYKKIDELLYKETQPKTI